MAACYCLYSSSLYYKGVAVFFVLYGLVLLCCFILLVVVLQCADWAGDAPDASFRNQRGKRLRELDGVDHCGSGAQQ